MRKEKLPGSNQFDRTGKAAIITGGAKGLGLAMPAFPPPPPPPRPPLLPPSPPRKQAAEQLSDTYETKVASFSADVTVKGQTEAMAQATLDAFGRIDILINSAGINIRGAIDEVTEEEFKQVMDVNVTGTWLCSRAVTPQMKKQQRGSIINLASTLGLVGLANRTPYTASKGAVVQMTRALALELAPFNINVNAICPGPFLTEMNIPIAETEEAKKFIVGATALARWGELKEIQGAAIFLASDAASYVVGSMLTVDGGWTAK